MYLNKKQALSYGMLAVLQFQVFNLVILLTCCYSICERVTPRLSHANSAVVLSAVKVLMKFLELLPKDSDYYNTLLKKLSPPLVTLLSGEPEVQYVALRNINLIVQKRSVMLFTHTQKYTCTITHNNTMSCAYLTSNYVRLLQ